MRARSGIAQIAQADMRLPLLAKKDMNTIMRRSRHHRAGLIILNPISMSRCMHHHQNDQKWMGITSPHTNRPAKKVSMCCWTKLMNLLPKIWQAHPWRKGHLKEYNLEISQYSNLPQFPNYEGSTLINKEVALMLIFSSGTSVPNASGGSLYSQEAGPTPY